MDTMRDATALAILEVRAVCAAHQTAAAVPVSSARNRRHDFTVGEKL